MAALCNLEVLLDHGVSHSSCLTIALSLSNFTSVQNISARRPEHLIQLKAKLEAQHR